MSSARRRLLQAGLVLTAAPAWAWAAWPTQEVLKAATGPGWADWRDETPPLALPDLDGRERMLCEFENLVVVVSFWASWCEPCREEFPAMSALARKHHDAGLRLLAVNNAESRSKIDAFLHAWPVEGLVLSDRNGAAAKEWGVVGMPANFVIDRTGALRYWHLGALDWSQPAVADPVVALLRA